MKKIFALTLVLAMLLTTACFASAEEAAPVKIGVLLPEMTHTWISGITYYAQEYGKKLEAEGIAETRLSVSSNAETMTAQIEEMIQWGAQALILSPQWTGMEAPVQDAIDRGIVVVAFDIDIAADGIYKVTGDNRSMGVINAQFIVENIGTTGTVVLLTCPTAGSVNALRLEGFYETMREIAPEMVLVEYASAYSREQGLKDMADALMANETIDAVFSTDDEASLGALQAIEEAGRTDLKVMTGGGGCQAYFREIKENTDIIMSTALYPPTMIINCFDVVMAVLHGQECDAVLVIPSTIVSAENVDEYLDENNTIY